MEWYVKITIYILSITITSIALYQVDFNNFMRTGRNHFAILVWLILSLALGYLIGSLFLFFGEELRNSIN